MSDLFTASPAPYFPLQFVENMKVKQTADPVLRAVRQNKADVSKLMLAEGGVDPDKADEFKRFHLHTTYPEFLTRGGRKREPLTVIIQNEKYRFRASHIENGEAGRTVVLGFLKTPGNTVHKAAMLFVGNTLKDNHQ